MSHSITCSTALHAVINAVAWLKSGMARRFIVGGSEAPLTGFTLAQMRALRIYSDRADSEFPCQPLACGATENSLVLGEGAALFCVESAKEASQICIDGVGYATEGLTHNVSLSANADCLQRSMKMAIKNMQDSRPVDIVVMHAPGTLKGDAAELRALEAVFGEQQPLRISNKWQIGHTFGAAGALSMGMAILMLQHNQFVDFPYPATVENRPDNIQKVLVNAVGFGGNAASVILSKQNKNGELENVDTSQLV